MPAIDRTHLVVGLPFLLATVLLTVPLGAPVPTPGLDPSWRLVLNLATDVQFGRDIIFTYGPWGYLDSPLITSTGAYGLALLIRACVIAALWVVSVRGLMNRWPLWAASPAVSIFVVLVATSDLSTLVVAVTAQYVLRCAVSRATPGQPRTPLIGVACLAALTGVMIQVKFSNGVAVGALAALALVSDVGLGRRRQLTGWGYAITSFLGVGCAAWLARGQSLADVGPWLRGSVELTAGYPEAMGIELIEHATLGYVVAGLLVLLAVAASVPHLRELQPSHRVGVLLVVAVVGGFAFKSAFTRHDDPHQGLYFVVVGALFFVLVGSSTAGSWLAATGGVLATVMAFSTLPPPPGPVSAAARWRDDVSVLASRDHRIDALATARAGLIASHQVPDSLLAQVRGRPVSIDPYEASVAWAYGLNWHPVPVFQLYAAYTPALDRLNATALREAPARQQVLRHQYPFTDGRNQMWDSPLYQLALACNYRTVAAEASWVLLAKGPSRCGQPTSSSREQVVADRQVDVPHTSGNDILLARFTPSPAGALTRLGRALVKPFTPMVVAADDTSYRLSRQTSPSGVIVGFPAVEAGAFAPLETRSLVFSVPGTLEFVRIPLKD